MALETWLITAVLSVAFVVIWWSFRRWMIKIDEKFDKLIESVQTLGVKDAKQQEQINQILGRTDRHDELLNKHSDRIRNVEINYQRKDGK